MRLPPHRRPLPRSNNPLRRVHRVFTPFWITWHGLTLILLLLIPSVRFGIPVWELEANEPRNRLDQISHQGHPCFRGRCSGQEPQRRREEQMRVEQYDVSARGIAAVVVSRERRDKLLPRQPAAETRFGQACARRVVEYYGPLLFRRPLTSQETKRFVATARLGHERLGSGRVRHTAKATTAIYLRHAAPASHVHWAGSMLFPKQRATAGRAGNLPKTANASPPKTLTKAILITMLLAAQ